MKVADFGLAYMKTETRSKTGRQLGSPLWMAPEVHEGKFHSFNSDVFSFGVVMFEVSRFLDGLRQDMSRHCP